MTIVETIIVVIEQTLVLLVLLKVLLSYFVDPFNSIRQAVDRLVEPLLRPIRQIVPTFGRFDFSPVILIIIIEVITRLLLTVI